MPSPTSSTRPTSLRVTSGENCSISRWMTELISSALNFMRLSFDQSLAKLCEPALRRRVVTEVTYLDHQAGDQIRVGRNLQERRRPGQPGKPFAQRLQLALVQRERRANLDGDSSIAPVPDGASLPGHDTDGTKSLVTIEDPQEPQDQATSAALEKVDQDAVFLGSRDSP